MFPVVRQSMYEPIRIPLVNLNDAQPGDHILFYRPALHYSHHAIVKNTKPKKNKLTVIHYYNTAANLFKNLFKRVLYIAEVTETTFIINFANEELYLMNYDQVPNHYSHADSLARAQSCLGERKYDLIDHNCEHFARWCRSGESFSQQVFNVYNKIAQNTPCLLAFDKRTSNLRSACPVAFDPAMNKLAISYPNVEYKKYSIHHLNPQLGQFNPSYEQNVFIPVAVGQEVSSFNENNKHNSLKSLKSVLKNAPATVQSWAASSLMKMSQDELGYKILTNLSSLGNNSNCDFLFLKAQNESGANANLNNSLVLRVPRGYSFYPNQILHML